MHGFTSSQVPCLSASLEGRRVSVGIAFGERCRILHPGIEKKSLVREIIADKADDDGVPENSGWFGNCVEQLACELWVSILTNFAESRTDRRCLGSKG